jgi:hypothetical protein
VTWVASKARVAEKVLAIHNHPSSSFFSWQDISTFSAFDSEGCLPPYIFCSAVQGHNGFYCIMNRTYDKRADSSLYGSERLALTKANPGWSEQQIKYALVEKWVTQLGGTLKEGGI